MYELNKRQCEDEFKILEWKVYIKKTMTATKKPIVFFLQSETKQKLDEQSVRMCIDMMEPMCVVNHFVSSAFKYSI